MDFKGLAERFAAVKERDDVEADKLAKRLEEYEEKRPLVLARAHAHVDQKAAALKDMEDGLNILSNVVPTKEG